MFIQITECVCIRDYISNFKQNLNSAANMKALPAFKIQKILHVSQMSEYFPHLSEKKRLTTQIISFMATATRIQARRQITKGIRLHMKPLNRHDYAIISTSK